MTQTLRATAPARKPAQTGSVDPTPALERLIILGRSDPVKWVKLMFGVEPNNYQADLLARIPEFERARLLASAGQPLPPELEQYRGKYGFSIMSGKGCGKDAVLAWLILRALICFPRPKGMVCAPVAHQLQSIVWAEVSKWLNIRNAQGEYCCPLRSWIRDQNNKIYLEPTGGRDSFFEPRTASPNDNAEDQAETLAGRHEDYLFVYVTEASAVPDPVYRPIETTFTGKCNYAVLMWNPTRLTGYAHRTHYGVDRSFWVPLHWDAEQCSTVSADHIQRLRDRYGADSNMYRVNVRGLPPTAEDGTLIPWESVQDAIGRPFDLPVDAHRKMGADVGRQGDESSVVIRTGPVVSKPRVFSKPDLTEVSAIIMGERAEHEPDASFLDVNGMGWGVHDMVRRQMGSHYWGVNVTQASRQPERFYQLRDELYWRLRDAFMTGQISIPQDEDLIAELTSMRYDTVLKQGRSVIKVWSKKEMKRRGLPSPNRVDALALTYYLDETFFAKKQEKPEADRWQEKFQKARRRHDFSWMGR